MTISHTSYIYLMVGVPIFLMGIFVARLKRLHAKENAKTSSILRQRSENRPHQPRTDKRA